MGFSDFAQMKKTRGTNSLEQAKKQMEQISNGSNSSQDDDRFWQPEVDKAGNGQATIRFLPAAPDNEFAWARTFNHGFKNDTNGKWYIEECPSTIGQPCPLCEANSVLWNTGVKENQDIVRTRKRKLHYIANVLIIKDAKHPENEGQVKLFKFGTKIFDKIKDAMEPKFEDETPINPFDFWEGANFKLKICKVEGYRNYDRSEFENPTAINDDDEEIEKIWKSEHDLKEFTAPDRFKPHAELKKRLDLVLGGGAAVPSAQQQAEQEMEGYIPPEDKAPAPARQQREKPPVPPRTPAATPAKTESEDDEAAYFASLIND